MNARAKVRETEEDDDERWELGSATAVVIDGDKILVADMGEYKVVVCRDGKAYQINRRLQQNQQTLRRHWCRTFIPGFFFSDNQPRNLLTSSSYHILIKTGTLFYFRGFS